MKKLVLLTGSTGFVGRHILNSLISKKISVRLVVRGKTEHLPKSEYIESIVYTNDIFSEDSEWWRLTTSGVHTIIHMAWYAVPGKYLNATENLNCLNGTLKLAQGAVASGVKKFIGAGTCFEYKMQDRPLPIDAELQPLSIYASTKAAVYQTLNFYFKEAKVDFIWCRLFYIYGEGEDGRRLVQYVKNKLELGEFAELSAGKNVRDYMDVKDVAESIVLLALSSDYRGAVNVCSGRSVTIREFIEKIADQYNSRHLLKFGVRKDLENEQSYIVGVPSTKLVSILKK